MTFTHALSTNNYGPARFIVSASARNGTHTTIASALTAASSGDTIFIRNGVYTENLTLKAGVNLVGWNGDQGDFNLANVIIQGKCTFTGATQVNISNVLFLTNSDFFLSVGGTTPTVNLNNCCLDCASSTGIEYTSSGVGQIVINNCTGNSLSTFALFSHSSPGQLLINGLVMTMQGTPGTNTCSAGTVVATNMTLATPITVSSTGAVNLRNCKISIVDTTVLTVNGTGTSTCEFCEFGSGTASAVSVGAGATLNFSENVVSSSNTNAITGAGTINYQGLSFTSTSSTINTTTQSGGTLQGGKTQAPSAGFLGQRITATGTNVALTNNTGADITSISLTPGVWDVNLLSSFNASGASTAYVIGISTTTATLQGTVGDQQSQLNQTNAAAVIIPLSVPAFRVTLTATTTYFAVAFTLFSTGATTVTGRLSATRVG